METKIIDFKVKVYLRLKDKVYTSSELLEDTLKIEVPLDASPSDIEVTKHRESMDWLWRNINLDWD